MFIPLLILKLLQTRLKISLSKEFQKSYMWKIIDFFLNISPFIGLIISAHYAWIIKRDSVYDPYVNTSQYNKPVILQSSTKSPTKTPTLAPTKAPSVSDYPTAAPNSAKPTAKPFTSAPSKAPQFASSTWSDNYYTDNFAIVGYVTPGLGFIAYPALPYDFLPFLASCIPLTFVAFMEGYGVANRIATLRNELHILNASQEMWAIGVANMLGSVSSAFPVAGSFSRSSLNHLCGARTPLSKATCLLVIVTALGTLTATFFYIPQAALSAIIWVAIWPLVKLEHLWHAWRFSKRDFLLILVTLVLEFLFNTEIGLAVGLSLSLLLYVIETAFTSSVGLAVVAKAEDTNGIDVLSIEGGSVTFVNVVAFKNTILQMSLTWQTTSNGQDNLSNRVFDSVTHTLDTVLRPDMLQPVKVLPKAVVVDWTHVRAVDLTAFIALSELVDESIKRQVTIIFFNVHESILDSLRKYNIKNATFDEDDADVNHYIKLSGLDTVTLTRATVDVLYPDVYDSNTEKQHGIRDEENLH